MILIEGGESLNVGLSCIFTTDRAYGNALL